MSTEDQTLNTFEALRERFADEEHKWITYHKLRKPRVEIHPFSMYLKVEIWLKGCVEPHFRCSGTPKHVADTMERFFNTE